MIDISYQWSPAAPYLGVYVDILVLQVAKRRDAISQELESVGEDMDRMQALLDELDKLNNKVRWSVGQPVSKSVVDLASTSHLFLSRAGRRLAELAACQIQGLCLHTDSPRLIALLRRGRPSLPEWHLHSTWIIIWQCSQAAHLAFLATYTPGVQVVDMDVDLLDKKIDQMMPQLGFK
jgi:hypothetical protein